MSSYMFIGQSAAGPTTGTTGTFSGNVTIGGTLAVTGVSLFAAGTAGAPGVGVGGATDGVFRVSAGIPALTGGGVETLRASATLCETPAASVRSWLGRAKVSSPADSYVLMTDTAGTAFTGLQLGGTTSSYPMLKRSGTGLISRLADDSANAPLTASNLVASGTLGVTGTSTLGVTNTGALGATTGSFSSTLGVTGTSTLGVVNAGAVSGTTGTFTGVFKYVENIAAKTGDYVILVSDSGTTFTNTGAGGAINLSLPTPALGLCYKFMVTATANLAIIAPSGVIQIGSSVSGGARTATAGSTGSCVDLKCTDGANWVALSYTLTWTMT